MDPDSAWEFESHEAPLAPAFWSDRFDLRQWAFFSGILGGLLILVGGFAIALLLTLMSVFGVAPGASGWFSAAALAIALWGFVTGCTVLLAALSLKNAGTPTTVPGLAMLAGGVLSFLAAGGLLLGGLLAIAAGALAIASANRVLPDGLATRFRSTRDPTP